MVGAPARPAGRRPPRRTAAPPAASDPDLAEAEAQVDPEHLEECRGGKQHVSPGPGVVENVEEVWAHQPEIEVDRRYEQGQDPYLHPLAGGLGTDLTGELHVEAHRRRDVKQQVASALSGDLLIDADGEVVPDQPQVAADDARPDLAQGCFHGDVKQEALDYVSQVLPKPSVGDVAARRLQGFKVCASRAEGGQQELQQLGSVALASCPLTSREKADQQAWKRQPGAKPGQADDWGGHPTH